MKTDFLMGVFTYWALGTERGRTFINKAVDSSINGVERLLKDQGILVDDTKKKSISETNSKSKTDANPTTSIIN